MLTDKEIQATIRSIVAGKRRRIELRDSRGERGGGQLVLLLNKTASGCTTDWYASWHRVGKRKLTKIGDYPLMSLAQARRTFRTDFLPQILKGMDPVGERATQARNGATFAAMCQYYLDVKAEEGQPSVVSARQHLLGRQGAVAMIGGNRPAASIRRSHILPWLAAMHDRDARGMAMQGRNVLHAAFNAAIRDQNSYYRRSSAVDWGLECNPVSGISVDRFASVPRDRHLSAREFKDFYDWLEANRGANRAMEALQLLLLTGQRPGEILQLSERHLDREQRLLYWQTTKNKRPHCLPVPKRAYDLLTSLEPNEAGLFFPRARKGDERMSAFSTARLVARYIKETGIEPFEVRDLRRTFKTLMGEAGVTSLELRDKLQNHVAPGVSSKVYDRWNYMPEKRQAIEVWDAYLDHLFGARFAPASPGLVGLRLPPSLPIDFIRRLHMEMGQGAWRASARASHFDDWVGLAIGKAMKIAKPRAWKGMTRLVASLLAHGVLAPCRMPNPKGFYDVPGLVFSQDVAKALAAVTDRAAA